MNKFLVLSIVDEGDRILLFGNSPYYHIIASVKERGKIKKGDMVEYERSGWNFGWFKALLNQGETLERSVATKDQ